MATAEKAVVFALEKGTGRSRPTAYVSLPGKPNLKQIVQAQRALLETLPDFKGFRLKACPGCHSGLEKIVIGFDPPELEKRFDTALKRPIGKLPQEIGL
jgi:hypothetical protein